MLALQLERWRDVRTGLEGPDHGFDAVHAPGPVTAVPIVGYVAASPILHVVHKEHRSALISGTIRIAPAVLGGLTRAEMADDSCVSVLSDGTRDSYGCLGHGLLILAGWIATGAAAIAVTAIDAAVLAYERAPAAKRTIFWVVPMPTLDGGAARVGATFGATL